MANMLKLEEPVLVSDILKVRHRRPTHRHFPSTHCRPDALCRGATPLDGGTRAGRAPSEPKVGWRPTLRRVARHTPSAFLRAHISYHGGP